MLAIVSAAAWIVARDRLIPRRTVTVEEELAGHTAALLMLGLVALLVVAVNAFALLFVLPSLHAWLWLPQLQAKAAWARGAVIAVGFAGPALLLWSLAERFDLGWDGIAYLAELVAIGYVPVPLVALFLAWLAVAGQLSALAARTLRAVPVRRRAAAARPDPRARSHARARRRRAAEVLGRATRVRLRER